MLDKDKIRKTLVPLKGRHTKIIEQPGEVQVRLHDTNVVIVLLNTHGVIINSGGWNTKVTAKRITDALALLGLAYTVQLENGAFKIYGWSADKAIEAWDGTAKLITRLKGDA